MTELEQRAMNAACEALKTANAAMDLQTMQIDRLKAENAELRAKVEMLEAVGRAKG